MQTVISRRTGFSLRSPVMAASGTYGYGDELLGRRDLDGLGAIVCKGTTRLPRAGHEPIRMHHTAAGMLNSIGLQNIGVDAVIVEKAPVWASLPIPVFVNVSATSIDDYRHIVQRLDGVHGIAGVELNISCPNVEHEGEMFGARAETAAAVTREARAVTQLPLIVKLSPNVADIQEIGLAVEAAGADAVCAMNTLYGMAIDRRSRRPTLANVTGGLSGPAIKPHALYQIYRLAEAVTLPVIGVGGILTGEDAIEFLLAGACAVELGTALLLDPDAWRRVALEISNWCNQEGVRSLDEIVGAANSGYKRRTGDVFAAGPN